MGGARLTQRPWNWGGERSDAGSGTASEATPGGSHGQLATLRCGVDGLGRGVGVMPRRQDAGRLKAQPHKKVRLHDSFSALTY